MRNFEVDAVSSDALSYCVYEHFTPRPWRYETVSTGPARSRLQEPKYESSSRNLCSFQRKGTLKNAP